MNKQTGKQTSNHLGDSNNNENYNISTSESESTESPLSESSARDVNLREKRNRHACK